MKRTVITAMGHYAPLNVISNAFFETLGIESSADWVKERTGIETRRSVLSADQIHGLRDGSESMMSLFNEHGFQTIAEMARPAWRKALVSRSLGTFSPDLLICGTSVPDFDIPANASAIASDLGLSAAVFDVNSACSSFVTDLHVTRALFAAGMHSSAAIFNVERYTPRLDFTDRSSCILFGDGAVCSLIESSETSGGLEVVDSVLHSDSSSYDRVKIPAFGTFSQDGAVVQKFAISKTCAVTRELLERNQISVHNISYFVGHQANYRMLESVVRRLGLRDEQHLHNVCVFGNQGGAGAPSVLAEHWERYRQGDLIVVAVVGAGLTWGAVLLRAI